MPVIHCWSSAATRQMGTFLKHLLNMYLSKAQEAKGGGGGVKPGFFPLEPTNS
jgi:hypothetical protein